MSAFFWIIVSVLRTLTGIFTMILWMLAYGISSIFIKADKKRALALREHWLKFIAFPLLGMKVEVSGKLHDKPALYVSNHRSFSDPVVLCRYLKAFVIAKAEVAKYPVISKGAELTGIIYVQREDRSSRKRVREALVETINKGFNVLVYPEGTVGLFAHTLPFKKGAFVEAFEQNIPVVPVAIDYKSPKDLWLHPNFIKQFILMYAKPSTQVKLRFGTPIQAKSVEELVAGTQSWIDNSLAEMQRDWTDITFKASNR